MLRILNNKKKLVPVSLLTGYLGAGKTTLMNHVLSNQEGYKVAVIVNDIGEVNIDETLLQRGGSVKSNDTLVPLSNGCICCTLATDLMNQIIDLAKSKKFDYILIEASGICEPAPIANSICMLDGSDPRSKVPGVAYLDNITTVVDARRMADEFGSGKDLLKDNLDEEDIENLLIQQIEYCTTIVLNKIDLVNEEEKKSILEVIKALQPEAKIIETTQGQVAVSDILSTGSFDYVKIQESAGWMQAINGEGENSEDDDDDDDEDEQEHHHHDDDDDDDDDEDEQEHHHHDDDDDDDDDEHEHEHHHHDDDDDDDDDDDEHEHHGHHHHHHHHHDEGEAEEYGISTFVYQNVKPFSKKAFEDFVLTEWPSNVIRAKGLFWVKEDPAIAYVFEQSGKQKTAREDGNWIAVYPEKERKQIFEMYPDIKESWDPVYGDRCNKLVFIGRGMDKHAIIKALDACIAE